MLRVSFSIAFIMAAMSAAEAKTSSIDEQIKAISSKNEKCLEAAVSTYEIGGCNSDKLASADSLLNAVYKSTVATLKRSAADEKKLDKLSRISEEKLRRLQKAQRAWIAFRDSDCELQGAQMLNGTGESLVVSSCLSDKTLERVKDVSNVLMTPESN